MRRAARHAAGKCRRRRRHVRRRPRTRMRRRAKPSWCDWGLGRRPSVETSRQRRRRRFPLSVVHVTPPGPPAGAERPILRFRGGGGHTGLTASTQSRGGLQKTVTRNAAVSISAKAPPTSAASTSESAEVATAGAKTSVLAPRWTYGAVRAARGRGARHWACRITPPRIRGTCS